MPSLTGWSASSRTIVPLVGYKQSLLTSGGSPVEPILSILVAEVPDRRSSAMSRRAIELPWSKAYELMAKRVTDSRCRSLPRGGETHLTCARRLPRLTNYVILSSGIAALRRYSPRSRGIDDSFGRSCRYLERNDPIFIGSFPYAAPKVNVSNSL
jgi:hypothetical protein